MINPKEYIQRDAINSLTGIKSSLSNLRKVIALTYLLYLANNKKSSILYAESKGNGIVLKQEYKSFIQNFLNNKDIIEKIDENPLLTSQIESLYVGITLMFALGRLGFENSSLSMTKERTGGVRYPKRIDFASNMMTFDLILDSNSEESVKETLLAWLQNEQIGNNIEQRICLFLNICIENNLFKLRHGENYLYFQTEGIYKSLISSNEVSLESDEIVGPTRILNSMLRENLVPWLNYKKSLVTVNENYNFNIKEYSEILNTSLSIRDIKVENNDEVASKELEVNDHANHHLALQQIYYGAPGTGKSYEINEITRSYSAIRTTFHPDSDYSTFVGAYKPVMSQVDLRDVSGHVVIEDGKKLKEERITYKYVKQAFLKAYLAAWQKFAIGGETTDVQFLIIEEINRGNCAQIFGDLFQLLDRADNGFSTYPIESDTDLQTEISKAFSEDGEFSLGEGFNIDGVVSGYAGITEAVKEGRVLLLPNNLYIWATMNTSDQSLFPIDSAFKRRWDWKYVKITDAKKDWKIKCGSEECDWWTFVTEINKKIAKETSSDDKKLGYFFCKPDTLGFIISEDKFIGKVLFYLWNDVFKDGDTSLFKVGEDTEEATFEAFYKDDNTVNIEAIRKFLVAVVGDNNIKSGNEEGPSLDGNPSNGIDYTKYSFNGETRLSKKDLGYKIVMKYINEHSDKTFEELQKDLAFDESVDNKYRYKGVLAKVEDINGSYQDCFGDEQTSSDSVNYKVLTWWNKYNIDFIINIAKKQGWSVEKETE